MKITTSKVCYLFALPPLKREEAEWSSLARRSMFARAMVLYGKSYFRFLKSLTWPRTPSCPQLWIQRPWTWKWDCHIVLYIDIIFNILSSNPRQNWTRNLSINTLWSGQSIIEKNITICEDNTWTSSSLEERTLSLGDWERWTTSVGTGQEQEVLEILLGDTINQRPGGYIGQ